MKWKELIKRDLGKDVEDLLSQIPKYLSADIAKKPSIEIQRELREAISKYPNKSKEIEEEFQSKKDALTPEEKREQQERSRLHEERLAGKEKKYKINPRYKRDYTKRTSHLRRERGD
jgi:Skp family chaperone for outer membrane proteins